MVSPDWDVGDISFEAFVRDLESVVDANGLKRFPLLGISQGCAVSIAYAVRHAERVSGLVLYGGYARGTCRPGQQGRGRASGCVVDPHRQGWGQENPRFDKSSRPGSSRMQPLSRLLEHEPACPRLLDEVTRFLGN